MEKAEPSKTQEAAPEKTEFDLVLKEVAWNADLMWKYVKHHVKTNRFVAGGVFDRFAMQDFTGVYKTWGLDRNDMLEIYNYSLIYFNHKSSCRICRRIISTDLSLELFDAIYSQTLIFAIFSWSFDLQMLIVKIYSSQAKVPKEKKIAVIKAIRAITGLDATHARPSFRLHSGCVSTRWLDVVENCSIYWTHLSTS